MKKTKQISLISDELIDEWLKQGRKPEDVQGLLKQFTKRSQRRVRTEDRQKEPDAVGGLR